MNVIVRLAASELVLKREVAAPRELVFAAWTECRAGRALVGAARLHDLSCEMDVRAGGAWCRRMRGPDGNVITKYGVYREIAAPERLVFTYNTKGGGIADPETLVTVTFADLGRRTRLTLHQTAFEDAAARLSHEGGWTGCLERFAAFVVGDRGS